MCRRNPLGPSCAPVLMLLLPLVAYAQAPKAEILGRWDGTSICTKISGNERCHDETVVYRFIDLPSRPDAVELQAAKIVDGREEPMGELPFTFDVRERRWTSEFQSPRAHGLWSFSIEGNELAGVLYLLPDRTVARNVKTTRAQPPQPPAVPPQPTIELPPDLGRVLTDYEAAWQARDAAALAALFADDRIVVPNACAPVRGREPVRQCYAGSGGPLSLRAVAYQVDGALGYIIGGYTSRKGEPDGGKFTLTLARGAGGRWLIVADMDRSYPRAR